MEKLVRRMDGVKSGVNSEEPQLTSDGEENATALSADERKSYGLGSPHITHTSLG